jgi:predicted O-methyltransferase YrrM
MVSLEELLHHPPHVHDKRTRTWGIHPDLATFLNEVVTRGQSTLETGSGLSTLVILRKQVASHIAIAPVADEFEVLRSFCRENGIDAGPLRSVDQPSQRYLPGAQLPELDVVLIDGDHSFPAPFIDWYYTADRLKVGGLMIVDDTDIATGLILIDFMRADAKWSEVWRHRSGRFAVYRKVAHPINEFAWWSQKYLTSTYPTRKVKLSKRLSPQRMIDPAVLAGVVYSRLPQPLRAALRSAKQRWLGDRPRP